MTTKKVTRTAATQRGSRRHSMSLEEALEECNRWFAHLGDQRARALRMQELAKLARSGPEGHEEARRQMNVMDRQPRVYNGDKLEEAVAVLVDWVHYQSEFLSKL